MTNNEAQIFINSVFKDIMKATSIIMLREILSTSAIIGKKINEEKYPKINLRISSKEIIALQETGLIDDNFNLAKDIGKRILDPISKLLYAVLWKQGDLQKVKHVIKGISKANNEYDPQDGALVFYQFGKYLSEPGKQPIIDQHVIRAFGIYKTNNDKEVTNLRNLSNINQKHISIINEYKKWLVSDSLSRDLRNEPDYAYHIDKILFATGKTVKNRKQKGRT